MDRETLRAICRKRLNGWAKRLVESGETPVLLVGAGHDDDGDYLATISPPDQTDDEFREIIVSLYWQVVIKGNVEKRERF